MLCRECEGLVLVPVWIGTVWLGVRKLFTLSYISGRSATALQGDCEDSHDRFTQAGKIVFTNPPTPQASISK